MNGLLVVDKPRGVTSHDVVQWARRALSTRAVGHAGTLDPMATGALLLLVGEGTKLTPFLTHHDKRYVAEVRFGVETDSLDADGRAVREAPKPHVLGADDVRAALGPLTGEVDQEAPAVSAIKVDGKALYERVRRGEDVRGPLRRVVLHEAKVLEASPEAVRLEVHCGKGYYVRALARDLSYALGTVGHLVALERTASGPFGLDRAVSGARLREARSDEAARAEVAGQILSLPDACEGMVRALLSDEGVTHARHGRAIPLAMSDLDLMPDPDLPVAMLAPTGHLIAIGRANGPDTLKVVRGFAG
jgi:tRNA pseudouridine55 synthase